MSLPLYSVTVHKATASRDLKQMKAIERQAEEFLAEHGNVAAALKILKQEIAKLESGKH